MDDLIDEASMASQYKSPVKKQIKRKCKSAGSANKTKRIVRDKFKYYDSFKFKSTKGEILENCENDSNRINVIPRKNLMEFDSPDKTEIIGNISCSEQEFKIDKKFVNWILKFLLIFIN